MERRETLRELRCLAGQTLERAASWLGVSTSQLHYIETGRAALNAENDAALRTFYFARIAERTQRASALIAEEVAASNGTVNQDTRRGSEPVGHE